MTAPTFDEHLHSLWQGFFSTYSSLSIFASKIGECTDQFDEEHIQLMANDLAFALDEDRRTYFKNVCQELSPSRPTR